MLLWTTIVALFEHCSLSCIFLYMSNGLVKKKLTIIFLLILDAYPL
jgi:hypothetical protein